MDLGDLINSIREDAESEKMTRADNAKLMQNFLKLQDAGRQIQVGNVVVRNVLGRKKYRGPKKEQVAICIKKFDDIQIARDGDAIDMIIAITMGKDEIATFPVNSAFYSKADEKKNVVDLF